MALSELFIKIKNIKVESRKMFRDERSLYLEAHPNGSKIWKYRYWENKKEKKVTIGKYPGMSLREARQKREEIESKISAGQPLLETVAEQSVHTFKAVAMKWYETKIKDVRTDGTLRQLFRG